VKTVGRGKAVNNDMELKDWGLTVRNLTMLAAIEKKRPNTDGVEVTSIEPGGPAAAAIPEVNEGDVIVAVDGQTVKSAEAMRRITAGLLKNSSGQRAVQVTFERGVSQYLTLVKLPHQDTPPEETPRKPGLQMILQPVGTELAEALGIESGVRVAFVFPDRATEKAGIRVGDILTRFDGDVIRCQQPEDVGQLLGRVRKYKVGSEVEFELIRGKETRKVTVTLEADGLPVDELKRWKDRNFELTLREMTEMERVTQRIPAEIKGVLVDEVMAAGWASLAHVRRGDLLMAIDGNPTPDVDTAEKLLKAAAEKKPRQLVFFLRHGVHSFYAELEPNWDFSNDDKESINTK
jgi:S1-C subfamily serine protease